MNSVARDIEQVVEADPTISLKSLQDLLQKKHQAGFKFCGREIIGLDGCFMKGQYPGQVLTAVGVDGNNGIYPVAYAIVETENKSSWTWFLEYLGDDVDISANSNFTFITDRQKGLIPAIQDVFPAAEHRYCWRHIHENMKIIWRGQQFKDLLWNCASATTPPQFDRVMERIRKLSPSLHQWVKEIPPKSWTTSHFSGRAKCDVLLNNLCEVFNRQLVVGRNKPIVSCLEYIREYLMKRIVLVHKLIAKSDGPLTPYATKTFQAIQTEDSQYNVIMSGANKFQMNGPWFDQCVVDVSKKTCSCRKWELTAMPCKHVVAAIWNMAENGISTGHLEEWVDEAYWLDTWKKVYMHTIEPINGRDLWIPCNAGLTTITPPKRYKQIGRLAKKRKKSAGELLDVIAKKGKITRKGGSVTCGICKQSGHNSRSCKKKNASKVASQSAPQPSQQIADMVKSLNWIWSAILTELLRAESDYCTMFCFTESDFKTDPFTNGLFGFPVKRVGFKQSTESKETVGFLVGFWVYYGPVAAKHFTFCHV
ncbi:uncharacterized protein LOC143541617 [Bidens hawaiensis]|uniref:uncharacterized protein LOC143541617 n=1 Tax=Bidens hawaiensis TaxID=980011 RepID=UPI00404B160D